jgi:hypothetical protein
MRHTTVRSEDKAVRLNHTTIDGWMALFGGPDFIAKRPTQGLRCVVSAI